MKRVITHGFSRRQFVKTAAATASAVVAFPHVLRGATNDKPIRIGVIGAGHRGCRACEDAITADPNVKLVAAADLWKHRLTRLQTKLKHLVQIDSEHCFRGFDAYKQVLEMDLDYVILATPPQFRPLHFAAAVAAGKHVFIEKPVAVDPVGIRKILATGKIADDKKLCVVAGTQRRHQSRYIETIKRLHDGVIGKIRAMQVYWNQDQLWHKLRGKAASDEEWMLNDWINWCWLSGDHVVEQHVHNTDIANWVLKSHPLKIAAMGGRHRRVTGDQYDFFSADLTYPDEVHVQSQCRQIDGCPEYVGERAVGEKGWSDCGGQIQLLGAAEPIKVEAKSHNPYIKEHADLIAAIRSGQYVNETQNVAESTLTNIMIRTSAYTGKEITWDEAMKSDLELKKPDYELTPENIKTHIPVPGSDSPKTATKTS